jgi:NADH-quinone oxidoreductase subunit L
VASLSLLAAEGPSEVVQASGWFLEHAWIIPLLPALSFVAILFFGKRLPRKGSEIGIAAVGLAFVLAVLTAGQWIDQVNNAGPDEAPETEEAAELAAGSDSLALALAEEEGEDGEEAEVGVSAVVERTPWWENGGQVFHIGIMVDGLTVMMLFVVTAISLLVHVYSTDYVNGDRRYTHFFAFLSLFTAAMLFFVLSENVLQMIVGWELVGVCSFALISHWWEDKSNSNAGLKAFLTNRVGDVGLLIGMIILYWKADSWSIIDINKAAIDGDIAHKALLLAAVCLTFAVMSKSGQFILHTWLPDAMAGPTPVSALIHAATMVVAGIYMVARLYGVFFEGFTIAGSSINFLALVGAVTLVGGGLLAFVQDDIKKVLAYSTVAQLGYMVMALGVGAWTAAVFHLFTHAFFKAGLFLGSGSVSHAVHSFDMKKDMGGLRKEMPTTFWTFIVCSLALMGIFPLAGFWSKDEILVGTGGWGLFGGTDANGAYTFAVVMGIVGAALTCAYMTRVIYLTFFGEFRGHGHPHESGPLITVPLVILAVMAVVAGFINLPPGFITGELEGWQERFFHYVEPRAEYFPAIKHGIPSYSLAIFSSLIALVGAAAGYYYFFIRVNRQSPAATELANGPTRRFGLARAGHTLLKNKYYLDHLYTGIVAKGTAGPVADAAYWVNQNVIDGAVNEAGKGAVKAGRFVYETIDQGLVDGLVNTSGKASHLAGEELRLIQTGKVQWYAGIMFLAATVIAGLFIVFV